MAPPYVDTLAKLRENFPQPVSDPVHDAYFVYSLAKALDRVDSMKSQAPILGAPIEPDWDAARAARVHEQTAPVETAIAEIAQYLEGMFIWGHPLTQVNVVTPPSIASIVGTLLPATYNPNLCSEEGGRGPAVAELRVVAMIADLLGYDPDVAGGIFTFGGTAAILYAARIGLEKACPGSYRNGVREQRPILVASDRSHYSCRTVAGWLGIGEQAVWDVPTSDDNALRIEALEETLNVAVRDDRRIACIVATVGTTDAFGLDPLAEIVELRDRLVVDAKLDYTPHVHADAAIGWAWSAFAKYDFEGNPLGFEPDTNRALRSATEVARQLSQADSIGVDFHKTGYAPYISSLVIARRADDFQLTTRDRETMPYLFHTGEYHPGMFTLETSRSGMGPFAALANLVLFGRTGLRSLLGHAVDCAVTLRKLIASEPTLAVMNSENVGPVTLFRVYPRDLASPDFVVAERTDAARRDDLLRVNDFNRAVFHRIHEEALRGQGVANSLTESYRETSYGEPIVALKSFVLSPFAEREKMHVLVDRVLAAAAQIEREQFRATSTASEFPPPA